MFEVEAETQKLKVTVKRQEHKDEAEVVGEAEIVIDGKWKDNEFDGEWVALGRRRDGARERLRTTQLTVRSSAQTGSTSTRKESTAARCS